MIDSSPKPLPSNRLDRLMRGLRGRMNSSAQKVSLEIGVLNEQMSTFERNYRSSASELSTEQIHQANASTTEWDESLQSRWDDSEMRSFKAVFETAEKEALLVREAKQSADHATAEAKKRISAIDKRFLQSKDLPIKRLNAFRTTNAALLEELAQVEASVDAALTQRSLRIPNVEIPELELPRLKNSDAAIESLQACIAAARQHNHRLANHPASKFFSSIWWWTICVGIFAAVAGGSVFAGLQLAYALVAAVCAAVVAVLASLIAIHPLLKRSALIEYPKVLSQIHLGRQLHERGQQLAIAENDNELKRLASKRDERFEQAKQWRDTQVKEITAKYDADVAALRDKANLEKRLASENLTKNVAETNQRYAARLATEAENARQHLQDLENQLAANRDEIQTRVQELSRGGALRMHIATEKATKILERNELWCSTYFPAWDHMQSDTGLWPGQLSEPMLPLGNVSLTDCLPSSARLDAGESRLQAPFLFSPIRDGYLTITGDPNLPAVALLVRNLVMRALTTLTPGKAQVCVIDPPGLGRDFGWLMHLSDFDPSLVTHRVWTQATHIANQLETLARNAEDFIQQSLRNQYQDIVQYNRDAGALAEPYRMLVWSSMPSGLDEQSWRSLQSILDSGPRCGMIPILIIDPAVGWPMAGQQEVIMRRGVHLSLCDDGTTFRVSSNAIEELLIKPLPAAPELQSQEIVKEVGRRALLANRIEVPLERMLPAHEDRWKADSSQCLEIPIGQSGVGRTHSLKLGIGTAQHAIIAGKTGSGKSSLLHAMITSALLKYSPDRLRLVLLDFKKGVEFQVYSDAAVAHADIIGIESHREFGLSALEYVDSCMQRRGESFRKAGVQDIASWNAVHSEHPMPRMLIVVDEFQELFVEDDKLSGQASLILDRIVRQGRSFGVHAVLSSQTLAGAYSLPRTTLGQMGVRVALQCDPSDAAIIFAEDNPAAARLKHPGQAVYNDAGGRIEGNQPMQIGWLSKATQIEWFGQMPQGYQNADSSTNRLGRTVVYDGNRAATWSYDNAQLAIDQSTKEINPEAIWCVVGESVAISPAVTFPLTKQTGRNVLIVGADDPQAAAVMNVTTASFVRAARHAGEKPMVYCVQGAKPTDSRALALPAQWKQLDAEVKASDIRGTDAILKEVYELLQQRLIDSESNHPNPPLLLNLIQVGRLRSLRKEDDFASFGETELTPDKHLEEILRDGPSNGIFTMIWAESYSTVNRWLSRGAIREIEIRVLMQMSANDSTNLIDTLAASRLGDHVMLVFDEATGQEQKFRPFDCETLADLTQWCNS
jgi:DNA segregation ATPase FtsK/SpoIIIE, S-DNA-T family